MQFSWLDLKAFLRFLPPNSALERALNPDAWVTPTVDLLRAIFDRLGGTKTFLTDAERKAALPAEFRFDAVPLDQLDAEIAARMNPTGRQEVRDG